MSQKELENEMQQLQKEIEVLQKKISQEGLLRLFSILAALVILAAGFIEKKLLLMLPGIAAMLIFIVTASLQQKAKRALAVKQAHLGIDKKRLARKNNSWQKTETERKEKLDAHYLLDLDVFGKDSLYDYLHFCTAEASESSLADYLKNPLHDKEEILKRQLVFEELATHPLTLDLLIEEALLSKQERMLLQEKDFEAVRQLPFYLKLFTFVYPWIGLAALFLLPVFPGVLLLAALLAGLVAGLHFDLWQEAATKAQKQFEATEALGKLAQIVLQADFQAPQLKEKQACISRLYQQRKRLGIADQLFKMRGNPLLLMVLDGLCFYDGWLYYWFSKQPPAQKLLDLQQALGDMGALCSLAQWLVVKEKTVFPQISSHLAAKNLKHPLMESNQAVGADFDFEKGPVIITGSNMAGKTTFMRSLGLNLVLFYTGLSVDADTFCASLLDIYTSMRVADRTQEGISTFYGELIRIKEMIQCAKAKQPALFLIDEIFKGTNLKDRIIGAKAVIRQLSYDGAFLVVSTHDEQLCTHEEVTLTNIHFSEYYQDGEIYFDYKLKPGVSQTTNARFLMQMIGLLE